MKRVLTLIAILISLTAVAQVKPDYSKLPAHPRLFLKAGDIEAVRSKITTDIPFRTIHSHIENYTENKIMYAAPSVFKKQGKRLLGVSRRVLERVYFCSYLYLVTGNEKYAHRAEEEMLAAAKFESWNPSHFL
ncbi:MAG: heparinase, partial [Alistipes sp.]|nr:heparinase [Alistipes sp.]